MPCPQPKQNWIFFRSALKGFQIHSKGLALIPRSTELGFLCRSISEQRAVLAYGDSSGPQILGETSVIGSEPGRKSKFQQIMQSSQMFHITTLW